jgi:hypothetical protein
LLETGDVVGAWVVTRPLGPGRVADVFEIEHGTTGNRQQLAVLRVEFSANASHLVRQYGLRHPNLVMVHGPLDVLGYLGLIVDPFEGQPLSDLLGSLEMPAALDLFRDVLSAVAAAHEAGVLHLDLHPDNILVGGSAFGGREVKLTGFGFAKLVEDVDKSSRQIFSRLAAPEMFTADDAADERADVFSLGALLYEMVTGKPAFEGDVVASLRRRATATFTPVADVSPSVQPKVAQAIARCMRPKRGERFQTAAALGRALYGDAFTFALAERTLEVPRTERGAPAERTGPQRAVPAEPPRQAQLPAWILAVAVVIVVGLGAIAFTGSTVVEMVASAEAVGSSVETIEVAMTDRTTLVNTVVQAGGPDQQLRALLAEYDEAGADKKPTVALTYLKVMRSQVARMASDPSQAGAANRVELGLVRVERALDNHRKTLTQWDAIAHSVRGSVLVAVGLVDAPSDDARAFLDS